MAYSRLLMWRPQLVQLAQLRHPDPVVRQLVDIVLWLVDEVDGKRSDVRTASNSRHVCTCPFKPYPHPSEPKHAPFPARPLYPLLVSSNVGGPRQPEGADAQASAPDMKGE